MIALSFTTEEGTASEGLKTVMIEISDPIIPEKVAPPELKPPPELTESTKNLEPVVVSDTSQTTSYIPINDELIETVKDGDVTDDVIIIVNPDPVTEPESEPFIVVEEPPEFPGGNTALMKFISENLSYPSDAQDNNIQGRVILKFVVNTDGSADRIEVLRSIDPLLDNEAVRVVTTLPRFKPGKQGGVPVPVWFTLPVVFKLENY
jgi:protein TonB